MGDGGAVDAMACARGFASSASASRERWRRAAVKDWVRQEDVAVREEVIGVGLGPSLRERWREGQLEPHAPFFLHAGEKRRRRLDFPVPVRIWLTRALHRACRTTRSTPHWFAMLQSPGAVSLLPPRR